MAEPKTPQEEARLAAIRAAMRELRLEYAEELPGLLADLRRATMAACVSGTDADLRGLQTLAHRMHGAAGSYGFTGVSAAAAKIEVLLAKRIEEQAPFDDPMREALGTMLADVQAVARRELDDLAAEQAAGQ